MATNNPKPIRPIPQKDIDRFWSHVEMCGPDECWPWTKGKTEDGYGRFKYLREEHKANRIAYFLSTSDDPDPELRVLHSCDFSTCCNPKHLRKGTIADNVRDRDERGRTARGDNSGARLYPERLARGDRNRAHTNPEIRQGVRNGRAKLTEPQVLSIRRRYAAGENGPTLAIAYGVTRNMIYFIAKGQHWKHLSSTD